MTKRCYVCAVDKPVAEYYRNKKNRDGLHSYCKPCFRAKARAHEGNRDPHRRRLYRYGLTPMEFEQMMAEQGGRCAGCRNVLRPGRAQHIDHCHSTGRVRGVLCRGCNHALGQVRDEPETLRRLAAYLERD